MALLLLSRDIDTQRYSERHGTWFGGFTFVDDNQEDLLPFTIPVRWGGDNPPTEEEIAPYRAVAREQARAFVRRREYEGEDGMRF